MWKRYWGSFSRSKFLTLLGYGRFMLTITGFVWVNEQVEMTWDYVFYPSMQF